MELSDSEIELRISESLEARPGPWTDWYADDGVTAWGKAYSGPKGNYWQPHHWLTDPACTVRLMKKILQMEPVYHLVFSDLNQVNIEGAMPSISVVLEYGKGDQLQRAVALAYLQSLTRIMEET